MRPARLSDQIERGLRIARIFHIDADERARIGGARQHDIERASREVRVEREAQLGELDGEVAAQALRLHRLEKGRELAQRGLYLEFRRD